MQNKKTHSQKSSYTTKRPNAIKCIKALTLSFVKVFIQPLSHYYI